MQATATITPEEDAFLRMFAELLMPVIIAEVNKEVNN